MTTKQHVWPHPPGAAGKNPIRISQPQDQRDVNFCPPPEPTGTTFATELEFDLRRIAIPPTG
jgi:hypothetical protein